MKNIQNSNIPSLQEEPDYSCLYDCSEDCGEIWSFCKLVNSLVLDIKSLEEEMVRWRQALLRYLTPEDAANLKSDIYNNLAARHSDNEAYQIYMKAMCGGQDPMESDEHSHMLRRHKEGTDDTSVVL